MLVLSRRVGEKIVIDGDITVTVTGVSGSRVSLGLEAPQRVLIRRSELVLETDPGGRLSPATCAHPSDTQAGQFSL